MNYTCNTSLIIIVLFQEPTPEEMEDYLADPDDPDDWTQTAINYLTMWEDLMEMFTENMFIKYLDVSTITSQR